MSDATLTGRLRRKGETRGGLLQCTRDLLAELGYDVTDLPDDRVYRIDPAAAPPVGAKLRLADGE